MKWKWLRHWILEFLKLPIGPIRLLVLFIWHYLLQEKYKVYWSYLAVGVRHGHVVVLAPGQEAEGGHPVKDGWGWISIELRLCEDGARDSEPVLSVSHVEGGDRRVMWHLRADKSSIKRISGRIVKWGPSLHFNFEVKSSTYNSTRIYCYLVKII